MSIVSVLALDIQGLKQSFDLKPVLRGVNLTVRSGECMALVGANGTGKTTLLRVLAGLLKPGAGHVHIYGLDLMQNAQEIRSLAGFVAHQPYLYEELTARENLLFFGQMYTVKNVKTRTEYLLRKVGMERRASERISTLSRGQVQRIALARALLHSPRLLLLDEPDTGMDAEGNALIQSLLEEHREQGGSTLFTTHQLERAFALSDSIGMLHNGRIVFQQRTADIELHDMRRTYQEVGR